MKAIIVREYGEADVLKLEEAPMPSVGVSDVLVKIRAAGVNPVDTYIRQGVQAAKMSLPYIPGKDGAGTVEAVGEAVTKFVPGDRVFTTGNAMGTYAEYCVCAESQLQKLPFKATFEEGAAIGVPYQTAFRALFQKAKAIKGESVLIHGASGAVGIAAIQWAKSSGLKVFGTAGSITGLELIRNVGVDFAFDHSKEGYLEDISAATENAGIDVILEMLANQNLVIDFKVLAKFGRIVVVGSRGSLEFDPRLTMTIDASIIGMSLFNAPDDDLQEIQRQIEIGIEAGFIKPIIKKIFPLEEATMAQKEVIEQKAAGKIVLVT